MGVMMSARRPRVLLADGHRLKAADVRKLLQPFCDVVDIADNGQMLQVFSFLNSDGSGAPREIIPTAGDTFTVLETWLDLDAQGRVAQRTQQTGSTLTFSDQAFFWEEFDAAPGEYIVGFIVEDLDGNATQTFTQVTVE